MRLLILEDDALFGQGLRDYLRAEGHIVDLFTRLGDAQWVIREPYDVYLVDWQMPDGSGVEWVVSLRSRGINKPIIILSARELLRDRLEGLDKGADDFLVKPIEIEELSARIRAVRRRRAAAGAPVVRLGDLAFDANARTISRDGVPIALTAREWSLLDALVNRSGRVVSPSELESLIAGLECDTTSNTLGVHIFNLRRKLGPDIIQTSRGFGYRVEIG